MKIYSFTVVLLFWMAAAGECDIQKGDDVARLSLEISPTSPKTLDSKLSSDVSNVDVRNIHIVLSNIGSQPLKLNLANGSLKPMLRKKGSNVIVLMSDFGKVRSYKYEDTQTPTIQPSDSTAANFRTSLYLGPKEEVLFSVEDDFGFNYVYTVYPEQEYELFFQYVYSKDSSFNTPPRGATIAQFMEGFDDGRAISDVSVPFKISLAD